MVNGIKNMKNISKIKLIIAIIFGRGFFNKLENTLKYAINHHDEFRGEGSGDVVIFKCNKWYNFIWK
jgi:hypothetical protein